MTVETARSDLVLWNGTGGFSPDGREYVIAPAAGTVTPAPWVNVLANPRFGTVVSESGLGYTWSENAQLYRLTPWHNDPVSESSGEALYLRDEETGHFWSPTSSPCGGAGPTSLAMASATASSSTPRMAFARSSPSSRRSIPRSSSFRAKVRNDSGTSPAVVGDGLCRMGAGRPAGEIGDARDDGDRREERRAVCAQSFQQRVRGLGRLLRRR